MVVPTFSVSLPMVTFLASVSELMYPSLPLNARELTVCHRFDTNDACYGITWSEAHENHFVVACGDGVVRMYDGNVPGSLPLVNYNEHKREVYSVSWNLVSKDNFVSSSWDGTIKLARFTPLPHDLIKKMSNFLSSGPHLVHSRSSLSQPTAALTVVPSHHSPPPLSPPSRLTHTFASSTFALQLPPRTTWSPSFQSMVLLPFFVQVAPMLLDLLHLSASPTTGTNIEVQSLPLLVLIK